MIRYPALIEPGDDQTAWGVMIPDLPGCFSAGESLDDALRAAEEAVAAWIDSALDAHEPIPPPSRGEAITVPAGWSLAIISVADILADDRVERINVSLPRRVLARLDAQAAAAGLSRSALIARYSLTGGLPDRG